LEPDKDPLRSPFLPLFLKLGLILLALVIGGVVALFGATTAVTGIVLAIGVFAVALVVFLLRGRRATRPRGIS
jgi:4-amino-4-deoxy-L-arabinose transferase-like glycosyltransferase